MPANLREQPAAIVFLDGLIVEYNQSDIWLSEHLAVRASAIVRRNQLPGAPDDSMQRGLLTLCHRTGATRLERGVLHLDWCVWRIADSGRMHRRSADL